MHIHCRGKALLDRSGYWYIKRVMEYIRAKLNKKLSWRDLGSNPLMRQFNVLRMIDGFVQRNNNRWRSKASVCSIHCSSTNCNGCFVQRPGWSWERWNHFTHERHVVLAWNIQQCRDIDRSPIASVWDATGETWYMYTGDNVRPNLFLGFQQFNYDFRIKIAFS